MPKLVTITAPSLNSDGTVEVTGNVVHLYAGAYRHKFLIQHTITSERLLTHYASGLKLGSLSPIKLAAARNQTRMTDALKRVCPITP